MDIGFLFGWAKENGIKLPTRDDGNINVPAAFALYDEWKKKHGGEKQSASDTDSNGGEQSGTASNGDVVELDDNSELAKRVKGLSQKERVKEVENYLREVLGGREIEFSDGIKATVSNNDANKLARDTYHLEKGMRRTAELAEANRLIENARFEKGGEVVGHNKDKFSSFRYYVVTTRYKGEEETLRFNVGKDKYTGNYRFYAITVRQ